MDVTVSNFGEVKDLILNKLLPITRYITYDLQFTGLRYEKFQRDHINYLPFEKYRKIKYVAQTYQILQLGLSLVVFDKDSSKMKVYPFNFYLFPRNPVGFDKNLTLQLSCVKFNAQNGMDWNKWIREGINYVKLSQMQTIQDLQRGRSYRDLIASLPADVQSSAQEFIHSLKKISQGKQSTEMVIALPRYQSVQKVFTQIFYKYIEEHKLSLALKEHEEKLIVTKIAQSEREKIILKHQEQTYGFSLLFQHLWKQRIPFVGHNCNLDLMYIFHNFIEPLPDSYFEFKRILRASGNSFYDTKYISAKYPEFAENGSRLQDLVKFLRNDGEKIFQKKLTSMTLDSPFNRYSLDNQALHEAGYDSYITAWVFQQMMKMKEDVDKRCLDRLNLLNSFFYIDLSKDQDEINPYYAESILRVNISYDEREKQDLRTKRAEEVNTIKRGLEEYKDCFAIYEGYREIFIEIKKDRKFIMKRIFQMVEKKQIKEINTFASYLAWQKERANRDYKRSEEYKNNSHRAFEKRQRMNEESSSNSEQSSRKRIRKRQG